MANRWQYDIQVISPKGFFRPAVPTDELAKVLNERGALGWELVQIITPGPNQIRCTYKLVFKRGN